MTNASGMASMSPDALLAYCRYQLDGLDQEMQNGIDSQNAQLDERRAVEKVQSTLESFGTQGPTNGQDMAKCVAAFQDAMNSLPEGDPVRAQLDQQCNDMIAKYGYHPGEDFSHVTSWQGVQFTVPTPATLDHKPQDGEWKSTCDALGNLVSDIKDGAQIQMLHLQDLVSQQQQATELFTGMMSKTDQTLEDQSKAIGR